MRFAAAGVRVACLRSHFLVPLSRSSLVRYRCRVRFPCDGSYDDHVFDRHRLRLSPASVAWCFLMRIVCGEQIGMARLSDVAPLRILVMSCSFSSGNPAIRSRSCFLSPVPLRLLACVLVSRAASAPCRFYLGWRTPSSVSLSRPVPRIAGRGGWAGRLCLLAAVGSFDPVSFLSSACSFLTHRHLLGRERFPAVSSCLLCLVRAVYRSALRRGRSPRSSCVGMWGASSCFVAVGFLIVPVPFLVPCCCPFCFSPLFALFCDTAGGELLCGCRPRLARRSFSLLVVLGAGGVSAWRVIISGRSRRAGALCGLCVWGDWLPFLWYICIVNWLYISFDWIFAMADLPAATVICFELSLIDNAILIEIKAGELPILTPDQAIKYSGLAASRIADFVLANDYGIPDYLKAAELFEDGNRRLARAIRFVVNSLRVP